MMRAGLLAALAAGCELAALACASALAAGLFCGSGLLLLAAAGLKAREAER